MYKETERLNYKDVDKLVTKYIKATTIESKKQIASEILAAFHHYIMKYVSLLKGRTRNKNQRDTYVFLSLFYKKNEFVKLSKLNSLIYLCREYTDCDLYNEFAVMFLELLNKYKRVSKASFTFYISKYMRWKIRDWFRDKILRESRKSEINKFFKDFYILKQHNQNKEDNSNLDLGWVIDPGKTIYKKLNRYERFLIYLHYGCSISLEAMAKILGTTKGMINLKITKIRNKLKEGDM